MREVNFLDVDGNLLLNIKYDYSAPIIGDIKIGNKTYTVLNQYEVVSKTSATRNIILKEI